MILQIGYRLRHLFQIKQSSPTRITGTFALLQFCLNVHQQIPAALFRYGLFRPAFSGRVFLFTVNHRTEIFGCIACAQGVHADGFLLFAAEQGRDFLALDFITGLPQQLQQSFKTFGLLRQRIINGSANPLTVGGLFLIAQPLVIALAVTLRILHDGVSVLNADGVIEPPHSAGAAPKVTELPCLIYGSGVPNHMVMDMLFVDMGADDIGVFTLGKPLGKLTAQAVCFLRGDLAGDKGLPQKKSGIPISQACYQIEKYSHEGVFTGLFALVQIFVAMTPEETLYFANPGPDGKFNSDYYFHWADFNNEPVNDWEKIATDLLSIPMAHQMIGFYTVADDTDATLKVMRSYQYYAASAISQAVAKRRWSEPGQRGGFIWHTTGSGKTMTSFKSAQLIANSGDADKVVFLMDRIELGTQSLQEYRGFADDSDSVQATENIGVLVTKLKSPDPANTLIVTSIQKMSRIMEEGGYKAKDIELINRKRVVFIVDECHRDTFGEMIMNIKNTFPNAMFFGFTGTPIHDENKKKMNTTTDVFGNELHRYSIADGIRDKNVLGFDPTMVMTYKDQDVREAVALDKAKAETISDVFTSPKKQKI